jgi:hypothetical protein
MEVRKLTTDYERQIFSERLSLARATRGVRFKRKAASPLEEEHLHFGSAYAIFEDDDASADAMIAGFIMHDLGSLPQSFPQPDLSYLPAQSVIEGGDLWSLSKGAAGIASRIAPAIVGILQAQAVLLYPIIKPDDLTVPHRKLGYVEAGEPILNPFGETLEGAEIWLQPMILQGPALQAYIRRGFDFLFESEAGRRVFRFRSSYPIQSGAAKTISPPMAAMPNTASTGGNGYRNPVENSAI